MSAARASTAFDIEETDLLCRYLRERGHISPAEHVRCRVLKGGVSSRTVLVERSVSPGIVVKQALAKLRVEADWFSDPVRIHREATGLRCLASILADAAYGAVPELLFEDDVLHLIGMTAVPQPHDNLKSLFLSGVVDFDMVERCAFLLACIHAHGLRISESLKAEFADRTFFQGLRLEPYYEFTAGQVPEAATFLKNLVEATLGVQVTLVHGDFSPKNILIYEGRPFRLDHEVIHWGDPAFDLGFMLTHLLSKARHLPASRRLFAEAATRFWSTYSRAAYTVLWWPELEQRAIRHTLACMLARARGRSPLEYLVESERADQAAAVLRLIERVPASLPALIDRITLKDNTDADC